MTLKVSDTASDIASDRDIDSDIYSNTASDSDIDCDIDSNIASDSDTASPSTCVSQTA